MEQCPICKGEFDFTVDSWLGGDDTWLCSEKCSIKFEEQNMERDMPEEFEPPDYLDDPEEEETDDTDEEDEE